MTLPDALFKRALLVALVILVALAVSRLQLSVRAEDPGEYGRYVHSYLNSVTLGNWTYLEKPTFPVSFNESQILVGQNWGVVCPLVANRSYHVYFYGRWVNNGSEPKTDYDVYVYNPLDVMDGYHTESAGFPEHLGTTVDDAFFVPRYSGNYTFVIRNDPRESSGAQAATFMIIENVECSKWHRHYVQGKDSGNLPVFNTSWSYEFCTESQRIEVWVRVPETLDMYEVRLYQVADPASKSRIVLNNVPLAWEPGLYGNRSNTIGGYNMESEGYRGIAYESCEFYGQEMFLNFSSSNRGASLYHLVFIGEAGQGTVEFLVKTEFGKAFLKPSAIPGRVYPGNDTAIAYVSSSADLINATLQYSTNNWDNATSVVMEILDNRTCRAVIPGQTAGTLISYRVEADDTLENVLRAGGNFSVKHPSTLNISLLREAIVVGENVTVTGNMTLPAGDVPIKVTFASKNATKVAIGYTYANGTFVIGCRLDALGRWEVQATLEEDRFRYGCQSPQLTVKVEEPSIIAKYSIYIGGGIGGAAIAAVVVYLKKFKT